MEGIEENGVEDNIKKIKRKNEEIITNMKEVIISTKKKRRHQQRRRKENVKMMESEVTDISTIMNNTLNLISPNVSVEEIKANKETPLKENSSKRTPLSKNVIQQNRKRDSKSKRESAISADNIKSPLKMTSIKDHFSPKPKAIDSNPIQNQKLNAFEVMMNARNKIIGSNTPGKNREKNETDQIDINVKTKYVKRKLMLEEWTGKKRALKRKLDEEVRSEFMEIEINKGAKRLKKIHINGISDTRDSRANITPPYPERSRKKGNSQEHEVRPKQILKKNKESTKRKTRQTVRRYLSSDSFELTSDNVENDKGQGDVEFISKLSSPLKKRDSLLGYFPKLASPTSKSSECGARIPKSKKFKNKNERKRNNDNYLSKPTTIKKQLLNETPSTTNPDTLENNSVVPSNGSSRPKRSCVGKARYGDEFYYLEYRPKKSSDNGRKNTKYKNSARKSRKEGIMEIISNEDAEVSSVIIELESSTDGTPTKFKDLQQVNSPPLKLAPLFIKAIPKPSPDPELLKARQEFLMSGVPEKLRLEMIKQKQFEQTYEASVDYFPKVSHVLQLDVGSVVDHNGKVDEGKGKIIWKCEPLSPPLFNIKKFRKHNLIENLTSEKLPPLQKLPDIPNKRLFVKELKLKYEKFPTYRCYNQLREKYKTFSARDADLDTCQLSESFVVTRSLRKPAAQKKLACNSISQEEEEVKPPPSAPNGELLFTEKYKPMIYEEVLVNLAPVNALREFLSPFQIGKNGKMNEIVNDLELTNDSSINSINICNSVVLLGPNSSGKTNAVFALANELNFNVLEINAGMKRTGKKLLQELHEATQSHQVSKDSVKSNIFKQCTNGFKKKITEMNDNSSSTDHNGSGKMSLILVEDADITFEQDAGFVEAIYQLSTSSKRPVIIIANNPNCQHLLKLINQQAIHFSTLNALNISKFLSILSLVENCPIELDDIVSLYLYNNRNVRKTLLEMQFFIQSGGDRQQNKTSVDLKQSSQLYITSPRYYFSDETEDSGKDDQDIVHDKRKEKIFNLYMHKTLFEFYTTCQNTNHYVPFPVNYNILWNNVWDIFKASLKIQGNKVIKLSTKSSNLEEMKQTKKEKRDDTLNILGNFYENISVGANFVVGADCPDLCCPNLSEEISHYLVEQTVKINLEPDLVSYNLFMENKGR